MQEKDSGVEFEDFEVPDVELAAKIVEQVESFFADENLSKDAFLLKHIRRNKDGYVSLKLVASFRKVKAITKNWKVVAYSLINGSQKLSINDELTKVKRTEPISEAILGVRSRSHSVVAFNVPDELKSMASICEHFASFGEISSVKMLRNSATNYTQLVKKYPEIGDSGVALVEFLKPESAEAAAGVASSATGNTNWKKSMRALLIEEKLPKLPKQSDDVISKKVLKQRREKRSHTISIENPSGLPLKRVMESSQGSNYLRDRNRRRATFADITEKPSSPLLKGRVFQVQREKSNSLSGPSGFPNSVTRDHNRFAALSNKENKSQGSSELLNKIPEFLVRQPRQPDSSGGFKSRLGFVSRKSRSNSVPYAS
jgi:la-related protein 6